MEIKIIGIAGVAQVGKDTFCEHLIDLLKSEGIEAQRVAFADELKEDLDSFLLAKSGVSAYTTDVKEKELVRPLLVSYGRLMRDLTQGQYWINKLKEKVEKNSINNTISIVSDVRYANEALWINSTNSGVTLHLGRKGIKAANNEEEHNDPLTKKECNHLIDWETRHSPLSLIAQSLHHINGLNLLERIIGSRIDPEYSGASAQRPLSTETCGET